MTGLETRLSALQFALGEICHQVDRVALQRTMIKIANDLLADTSGDQGQADVRRMAIELIPEFFDQGSSALEPQA